MENFILYLNAIMIMIVDMSLRTFADSNVDAAFDTLSSRIETER